MRQASCRKIDRWQSQRRNRIKYGSDDALVAVLEITTRGDRVWKELFTGLVVIWDMLVGLLA
jgi:hypothetical protein